MTRPAKPRARLEMHEHHFITGPLALTGASKFAHSHDGGEVPHEHHNDAGRTGPAARTIDKDEWFAATGLRGGGRKKFTAAPSGPQFAMRRTEAPKIEIIIVGDGGASIAHGCGGTDLTLARMTKALDARVENVAHVGPRRRSA